MKFDRLHILLAVGFLLFRTSLAMGEEPGSNAADWPQFMGPNRDGVVAGGPKLLNAWPKSGPKLLWKSDVLPDAPTWGIGSPVVAGGKVYIFSCVFLPQAGVTPIDAEIIASLQDKQAGREKDMEWITANQGKEVRTYHEFERMIRRRWYNYTHGHWCAQSLLKHAKKLFDKGQKAAETLICLDATSGKELWRKEIAVSAPPSPPYEGEGFGFSCVPAVFKDKVYFSGACGIYCLDSKKNGEVVWQAKAEGSHGSPLILDGAVYFVAQELTKFDLQTGRELWRQPAIKCDSTSPGKWTHNGRTFLLCSLGTYAQVACVDPADGKICWKVQAGIYGVKPTPVTVGDTMVIRGGNGTEGFKISAEKAEKLWTNKESGDAGSSPVIYGDAVYTCTKHYHKRLVGVIDLKTGTTTYAQDARDAATCSTPILSDGKAFVLDGAGGLYGFKAVADKYEEVGYVKTGAARCSSPAIAGGKLFLRLKDCIACYDLTEVGNQ